MRIGTADKAKSYKRRVEAHSSRLHGGRCHSCPCIELWFQLHIDDQTGYIERGDAQRAVREKLYPGKSPVRSQSD
jgi:hypothetical protein